MLARDCKLEYGRRATRHGRASMSNLHGWNTATNTHATPRRRSLLPALACLTLVVGCSFIPTPTAPPDPAADPTMTAFVATPTRVPSPAAPTPSIAPTPVPATPTTALPP